MITALRLSNFRRHAELDLRFDERGQIILISGRNGVGKTTLLEAITYGLYAEGRHGPRNLDNLLRRGAELEGMEVELSFTVGDDHYRVLRRRDGKSSTAVLYGNDNPLVEGQREVSDEITRILGMDSAGFRLATIAQQKDLNGLASLTPSVRTRMVGRLLRLDAIARARDAASELHLNEARVAAGLRLIQPLETVEAHSEQSRAALADTQAEAARAEQALQSLRDQAIALAPMLQKWDDCHARLAHGSAELAIAEADAQRLQADIEAIVVPDAAVDPVEDLSVLAEEVSVIERAIAVHEAAAGNAENRRLVLRELDVVESRIAVLDDQAGTDACDEDVSVASLAVVGIEHEMRATAASLDAARQEWHDHQMVEADLEGRAKRAAELGSDCDSCGQRITGEHRSLQLDHFNDQLAAHRASGVPLSQSVEEYQANQRKLSAAKSAADAELLRAQAAAGQALRNRDELLDLQRRANTYRDQVARLPEHSGDAEELYARKAALALRLASSQDSIRREQLRAEAMVNRAQTERSLVSAQQRVADAANLVASATPGDDLVRAHTRQQELAGLIEAESEMVGYLRTEVAVAQERVSGLEAALVQARAEDERRRRHQEIALNAGNAKRLLTDVTDRLSTTVRPALEGAISNLLTTMSEGRFTSVKVGEDYEVLVEDDGHYRPLGELSGGEADLVALAMRLALAQIVSDRHGSGGAGFLILDEPLGSQDPVRRQAVLHGLRALRGTYQQIFLISHVDGIEDAADTVIEIRSSEDRSETVVDVT